MTSTARHERIVVVGGGATGTFAALGLRQAGHTGPLTLVAAERRVAYERPPLSKEVLLHPGSQAPLIGGQAALRAAGVLVRAGVPVVSIDRAARRVVLQGGESIDYDRVLLATGCRARPLSVPGGELALSLRDHDDADRLSARLVAGADVIVIGGGFVGLEVAAAAVARGARVRVLEAAPRLLGRSVPPALATEVAGVHAAHGVEVRCGVRIERLRAEPGPDGGILVDLAGSPGEGVPGTETLRADVVVAGVGAQPRTEPAAAAGLTVDDGIVVDAFLRTADPAIWAGGDCCAFPLAYEGGRRVRVESWRNAQDQGTYLATAMLTDPPATPFAAVPWFWSDQYDRTLQMAGLPDPSDVAVTRVRPDGVRLHFGLADDGRLRSAGAIGSGNAVARDIRAAQRLIAVRVAPDLAALADATRPLAALSG
ncbi:MAG: FAD-dependent oxidoreductase [Kineosporiaceae bacterium]|nr:FAD-dependent oxidoreductase [Kineosporiaceae bacterium]